MNRTDLTLIIVSAIVIALVLGWSARWLFDRLNHVPHGADENGQSPLDAAKAKQADAEAELARIQQEFASEYNQLKAELTATMDGLHTARQKSERLEAELEALKSEEQPTGD